VINIDRRVIRRPGRRVTDSLRHRARATTTGAGSQHACCRGLGNRAGSLILAVCLCSPPPAFPEPDTRHESLSRTAETIFDRAIRDANAEDLYAGLKTVLTGKLAAVDAKWTNSLTKTILNAPLMIGHHASVAVDATEAADLIDDQLQRFARHADLDRRECGRRQYPGNPGEEKPVPLELQAVFKEASALAGLAFKGTSAFHRETFYSRFEAMLADPSGDDTGVVDEPAMFGETLHDVVVDVEFASLDCAMQKLGGLLDPSMIEAIRRWAATTSPIARPRWLDSRIEGELLWASATDEGLLLIGAGGPNRYGAPAALIIDLGGDDLYLDGTGSARLPDGGNGAFSSTGTATAIIDLGGNDHYRSRGPVSAGGAVMGVAVLYDADGDDVYSGRHVGQGAAIIGHAALIDAGGDDLYEIGSIGQGAALAGSGSAFDLAGNDHWNAALIAQGSGGPMGTGILFDLQGDDAFRVGGRYPSSYGTPGVFQALGQGSGWGIRPHLAGGVGVLRDGGGRDAYFGGNFSQGTGYFLGTGILMDQGGDDSYTGSRYTQGSAAHLAAGILLDSGNGDDRYRGRVAANQGAGWDLAVGALVDAGGNDAYSGADFAQGSGAQNGVGLFFDGGGSDHYEAEDDAMGFSGLLTYGEGRGTGNLGIFADSGMADSSPSARIEAYRIILNGEVISTGRD
jgi:hypothetical protein